MNIKPIRSEEDYEAACSRIDEIFQAEPGSPEDDELEILLTLVEKYQDEHYAMRMPDPIVAIEIQMRNLGLSRKDLMECLGKSSGRVSDILNRRRALSLKEVRKLSNVLHIPIEVLSQDYVLEVRTPMRPDTHRESEHHAP
jgi:HTH-type transcriptional regulator / antitoxin HigA